MQDAAKMSNKIVNDNSTPSLITFEQSTYKSTESKVSPEQLGLKQNSNYAKTKSRPIN
jgi:hypothetical protein